MQRSIMLLLLTLSVVASACRALPPAEEKTATPIQPQTPEPTGLEATSPDHDAFDGFMGIRMAMVENQMRARDIADERVLAVMETVPRHKFVPPELLDQAYQDHPLPIGYGQTISQPYIVALMTEMLELDAGDKVLEIGTGSGYQAAVLAELTDQVYTIEIIPQLAERARQTLDEEGYDYVVSKQGDGYWGWEEYAPFDAIIVTAAPDHIPQPLLNQLADGGRMVIPVGPPGGYQSLWLITRQGEQFHNVNWGGVRFVPFTREGRPSEF